jgi:hypothetical protein
VVSMSHIRPINYNRPQAEKNIAIKPKVTWPRTLEVSIEVDSKFWLTEYPGLN